MLNNDRNTCTVITGEVFMDYDKIGERVRKERTKFDLKQEKFAEMFRLSPIYIG